MDSASPSCGACDAEPAGQRAGGSSSSHEGRSPAPVSSSDGDPPIVGTQQPSYSGGDATVVSLNVGGQVFTTTLGTLCAVPGCYLATLFSNDSSWAPTQQTDCHGRKLPFIDRSPDCFKHVLEYLRCLRYLGSQPTLPGGCGCSGHCAGCGSGCTLQQLRAEAEFYLLPGLARMCDLGPRFCAAGLCCPPEPDQQPQQQQNTDRPVLVAGLTSRQDSGHLPGAAGDALPTPRTAALEEIRVTIQQQQQQQVLPLPSPQPGPSLLARAVAAAQQMRQAQQMAWRTSLQLSELSELVLQHLLHQPLQAQQPDLVAALAAPGSGNRLELLLQYYPLGDLRIELECRTVPAGATPAAAAAAAAGAAAAGPGVGVGISGSSPSMLSPRDGWLEQQAQQQQGAAHLPAAAAAAAASAAAAGPHRPPTAGGRTSADGGSSGGGSIALPGPGWGGVTVYHRYRIRETLDKYICCTLMPGDGQQLQELPRAAHKQEVLRYSTLHKLLVHQAPRQSVAGLVWLLQSEGFAAVSLSTVLDTFWVAGNAFPGVKSVLTFEI